MDELSAEQKAERLARAAADRAAELALVDADKATRLAVERAVRDANVDRDLAEHSAHLRQINHSQEKMALSLQAVQASLGEMVIANQAVAKFVREQGRSALSKRTLWLGALGMLAAWGAVIAAVLVAQP
jgi:hypothetical protein